MNKKTNLSQQVPNIPHFKLTTGRKTSERRKMFILRENNFIRNWKEKPIMNSVIEVWKLRRFCDNNETLRYR